MSGVPKGYSQLAGAFAPKSCRIAARAAIPCLNSTGKLSRDGCGTPRAFRPSKVKAIPSQPGNDGTHHSSAGAT
jgi:hypothetical protein